MYVYGYPTCCCHGYNDGGGFSWIWAIIIVVFILFFFTGNWNARNPGCR